ncbi:glycoside hydrolase family 16 protein [Pedobacter frigiditerrae]|uniref:glycoside hydrolase family 16 protein n=1 Tax=Pedobacter frigiditerrae TaxID=2530452 RepID=UPI002931AC49|nr:glycoside hydrolase family 16 protein [Pedobacter frigiditerrae]
MKIKGYSIRMKSMGRAKAIFAILLLFVLLQGCKKEFNNEPELISSHKPSGAMSTLANSSTSYMISFSGYDWVVKNSPLTTRGPGNNYWSAANVWVDSRGYLHLKLAKNTKTGKWECAEIASVNSFGMGTYQFSIEGRVDKLDRNVVLGLFNYSGLDYYDEMDIEFARWGKKSNPNLNCTLYPAEGSVGTPWSGSAEFALNGTYSTYRFNRTLTSVLFQGLHGFTNDNSNLFFSKTCTESFISPKPMPILLNLWLFQGNIPSDKNSVEIIIQRFSYTP